MHSSATAIADATYTKCIVAAPLSSIAIIYCTDLSFDLRNITTHAHQNDQPLNQPL